MKRETYGFIINEDIQFDLVNKRLVRITTAHSNKSVACSVVFLNATLTRFLEYLLMKKVTGHCNIPKDLLIRYVWENHGMSASSQLLWRTVRELKDKFTMVGLNSDFITRSGNSCYSINIQKITRLLY
ncbi:hypothetical protein D8M09_03270 [Enterobacter sp. R1(2018)]|nr:hypothetical protein D8M09_03270 [Enterobacter sp. R1(2018)]